LQGLELGQHIGHFVGRVLHVQQQPVVAAVGQDFDADRAAQVRPQADLFLATQDGVLETVDGEVHGVLLKRQKD